MTDHTQEAPERSSEPRRVDGRAKCDAVNAMTKALCLKSDRGENFVDLEIAMSQLDQDDFTDMNCLVELFLQDVSHTSAIESAEPVLAEIRRAVAEGRATSDMAMQIVDLVPNNVPSSQKRLVAL